MEARQLLDAANWAAVHTPWAMIAASGLLSPLLSGIKKWFSVQSEKVMITLVALVAVTAAAVHYLLTTPSHNPSIVLVQGFVLAFMTQPVYFFVVKPFSRWFAQQVEAAAELKLAQAAILPAEEPQTAPKPSIDDIKPVIAPPAPQDAKVDEFTH